MSDNKILYKFLGELQIDKNKVRDIKKECINEHYEKYIFNVSGSKEIYKICNTLYGYLIKENNKNNKCNVIGCSLPKSGQFLLAEYDRCEDSLELYAKVYEDYCKNKGKISFKNRTGEEKEIKISGDIDYNFKMQKVYYFKKIVESGKSKLNDTEKKSIINKLFAFHELTYHPDNISIMPVTGRLNIIKQSLGNDRLDTFIYAIKLYYEGIDSFILNHGEARNTDFENRASLKEYLDSFEDIYDYCDKVYHINKELVDKLWKFGSKAIDTPEMVNDYLNLACIFWTQKNCFYRNSDSEVKTQYQKMLKIITEAKGLKYINTFTGKSDFRCES